MTENKMVWIILALQTVIVLALFGFIISSSSSKLQDIPVAIPSIESDTSLIPTPAPESNCQTRLTARVRAKTYDTAVNTGIPRAIKILQQAANEVNSSSYSISVDGQMGPKTRAAVCRAGDDALLKAYTKKQEAFYRSIVARNPTQEKFLKGWLRRAAWIPSLDFAEDPDNQNDSI